MIGCAFCFLVDASNNRMERLSLRSTNTRAKVMGTLVSISGALVVILYKGPAILSTTSEKDWVKGGLLLTVGYLLFSAWSILQVLYISFWPNDIFSPCNLGNQGLVRSLVILAINFNLSYLSNEETKKIPDVEFSSVILR